MAYGKGSTKTDLKRMADLGQTPMTPELAELRQACLVTVQDMARAVWPEAISDPRPGGKELDAVLLRVQSGASRRGFNNVWAEKMRLLAKSAVSEQWKRAQACRYCTLRSGNSLWAWALSLCRGMPLQRLPILVFHGVATQPWRKSNGQAEGYGG